MLDRPFGAPLDIELSLPPPPSVNRTRKIDWANYPQVKKWRKTSNNFLIFDWSGGKRPKPILGHYEILIILGEGVLLDVDNGLKCLIDLPVRLGLVVDDAPRYLRKLTVEWGDAPRGCRLILRPREPN